jgi:hypothetical protein
LARETPDLRRHGWCKAEPAAARDAQRNHHFASIVDALEEDSNMRRAVHALVTEAEWERVSPERPCPVCGADRGCSTHSNTFVSCERISSQWPLTTGAWLHRAPPSEASTAGATAGRPARAPADGARAPLTAALAGTRL